MQFFDGKTNIPEERIIRLRLVGGGNGVAPSVDVPASGMGTGGKGVTCSLTATGRVLLQFTDNPGKFVELGGYAFGDSTSQTTVKGFEITHGPYPQTANTCTLEIDIWNASQAAADLATTSWLSLALIFTALSG